MAVGSQSFGGHLRAGYKPSSPQRGRQIWLQGGSTTTKQYWLDALRAYSYSGSARPAQAGGGLSALLATKGHVMSGSLCQALDLSHPQTVALAGSGGKTTLMHALAAELTAAGQMVVITTTTKIFPP